jgi:hypothetical protein
LLFTYGPTRRTVIAAFEPITRERGVVLREVIEASRAWADVVAPLVPFTRSLKVYRILPACVNLSGSHFLIPHSYSRLPSLYIPFYLAHIRRFNISLHISNARQSCKLLTLSAWHLQQH